MIKGVPVRAIFIAFGSDIDRRAVDLSLANAKNARVDLESKIGESVISIDNALNYEYENDNNLLKDNDALKSEILNYQRNEVKEKNIVEMQTELSKENDNLKINLDKANSELINIKEKLEIKCSDLNEEIGIFKDVSKGYKSEMNISTIKFKYNPSPIVMIKEMNIVIKDLRTYLVNYLIVNDLLKNTSTQTTKLSKAKLKKFIKILPLNLINLS